MCNDCVKFINIPLWLELYTLFHWFQFRIEEDKKSFCFICSLPNHEFERRAKVSVYCVTVMWCVILIMWPSYMTCGLIMCFSHLGLHSPCGAWPQHVGLYLLLHVPRQHWHQWPQCNWKICPRDGEKVLLPCLK